MRSNADQTVVDYGNHNYSVDSAVGVCVDQSSFALNANVVGNPFFDQCHDSVEHMLICRGPNDVEKSYCFEHLMVPGHPNYVGTSFGGHPNCVGSALVGHPNFVQSAIEYTFGFVDLFWVFYLMV